MMWWGSGGWGWALGVSMMLGMLVFWGLVVFALVAVVRNFGRQQEPQRRPETILSERFAAGEIDEAEYRSRLEALQSQRHLRGR